MGIKSKISGKLGSVAKHADMLGAVGGYLGTIAGAGEMIGSGAFVQDVVDMHRNAVQRHNVAALPEILKIAENQHIRLMGLECRRMTLDDLFVSLTGRRLND